MMPLEIGNHTLRSETDTSGSLVVQARLSFSAVASGIPELLPRLRHPAGGHLRLSDPLQRGNVALALLDAEGASRMEGATRGEIHEAGRESLDGAQRLVRLRVEARDRS